MNWFNLNTAKVAGTYPGNTANQLANSVISDSVYDFTQGYYSGTPSLPATAFNIPTAGIELGTISFGDVETNGIFTLASNVVIGSLTTVITLNGTAGGLQRLGPGNDGVVGGTHTGLAYTPTAGTQTILSNVVSNANQSWAINGPTGEVLLNGTLSKNAAQTIIKAGGGELEIAADNSSGFLGNYIAQGGSTLLDNSQPLRAGTSTVQVASTTSTNNVSLLTNSVSFAHNVITVANTKGVVATLGGTAGQASSTWTGNIALNYPVTLAGGSAGTTTFSGVLSDGTGGTDSGGKSYSFSSSTVTKSDTGTVIISGSNTYSGGTNVTAGTLLVTNTTGSATGSGPVTVGSTAQLGGSGFISGQVTASGTIAPGLGNSSSATTLAIGASSILSGTTLLDLTAANQSDQIAFTGTGSPTFSGGTLNVADTTGFSLAAGQSYTLFGFAGNTPTGTFATPLGLPSLPSGLSWNTSSLYQTGKINIVASLTGSQWYSNSTAGNWQDATNWAGGIIPNGVGQTASFGDSAATSVIVTLTAPETVGTLSCNGTGTTAYTIAGNALTLSTGTTSPASITVAGGSHTISAPITLTAGLKISTSTGGNLTINGSVSGGSGGATVTTGSSVLIGEAGSINVPLIVDGNVIFATGTTGYLLRPVPSLTLTGGSVTFVPSSSTTRQLLSIGSGGLSDAGTIDLANNDLLLQAGGAVGLTQLTNLVSQSRLSASPGIESSTALSDSLHRTALGVILNQPNQSGISAASTIYTTFDGVTTGPGDVLVEFTYYGDANLDGVVDGSDYSLIDNGYLKHLTSWLNGDFNYDGVVDGSDYTLVDNAFNTQGGSLAGLNALPASEISAVAKPSAVPEPASVGFVGIGIAGLLARRRSSTSLTAI